MKEHRRASVMWEEFGASCPPFAPNMTDRLGLLELGEQISQ